VFLAVLNILIGLFEEESVDGFEGQLEFAGRFDG